jgi:GTP-binding protein Era
MDRDRDDMSPEELRILEEAYDNGTLGDSMDDDVDDDGDMEEEDEEDTGSHAFRSGFVAILGRPNVGKSTLLNRILGQKVAIVTPKAQTTRTRVLGILHRPRSQMIFIDTPGIYHAPGHGRSLLHRNMREMALQTANDVDAILYLVPAHGLEDEDWRVLDPIQQQGTPVLLLINKIDVMPREQLLPRLARVGAQIHARGISGAPEQEHPVAASAFAEIIPLSARRGDNVSHLLSVLEDRYIPEGPQYYPEDQVTDQPERFVAAEIIREKLFLALQDELPYSVAVHIDAFEESPSGIRIDATILTGRAVHKPMIIGRDGLMLKKVGQQARLELATMFGMPVHVQLWVKVEEHWMDNERTLAEVGYPNGRDHAHS